MHRKTTCTQLDSDTQQSIFPRSTFNAVQIVLVHKEGEANIHFALLVQVWQQDPLCRLAANSQSTWLHTSRKLASKRASGGVFNSASDKPQHSLRDCSISLQSVHFPLSSLCVTLQSSVNKDEEWLITVHYTQSTSAAHCCRQVDSLDGNAVQNSKKSLHVWCEQTVWLQRFEYVTLT